MLRVGHHLCAQGSLMTILAIHRQQTNWPVDPARPIFQVQHGADTYWVETDGASPDAAEIDAVLTPPQAPLVPDAISDRQFFQQLAIMGLITTGDAIAAVATGTIPASLAAFIGTLPGDQQFAANMMLAGATQFNRSHPMTLALAQGMGWTTAQLDMLWTAAAAL